MPDSNIYAQINANSFELAFVTASCHDPIQATGQTTTVVSKI